MQTQAEFSAMIYKINRILFFAGNIVSSNPSVGHFPRIKIYFFLLLICTEELISATKIIIFLQSLLPLVSEKVT